VTTADNLSARVAAGLLHRRFVRGVVAIAVGFGGLVLVGLFPFVTLIALGFLSAAFVVVGWWLARSPCPDTSTDRS
jgi:hypothetical protein